MQSLSNLQLWIFVLQVIGFALVCFKLYVKSYSTEKGKNLATKEDIGEITQIIESIKTSLTIKTEEIKSNISFKSEHLIHLRATERATIINYYKAMWVLVLNFTRIDLIKYEIDSFDEKDGKANILNTRYIADAELALNKIKEELSNLKYQKDIAESELMFFYDELDLSSIASELNLSLLEFERALFKAINLLLQGFAEIGDKINNGLLTKEVIIDIKRKRSDILANWYEDRYNSFTFIRTFNDNLKKILLKRLTSLT